MAGLLRRLAREEAGAVSIEYGLIGGLMAIAVATGFPVIAESLQAGWEATRAILNGAFS